MQSEPAALCSDSPRGGRSGAVITSGVERQQKALGQILGFGPTSLGPLCLCIAMLQLEAALAAQVDRIANDCIDHHE